MEREALKLALEALGKAKRQIVHAKVAPHGCIGDAITAIKEALAQPAQEPLCYASINKQGDVCSTLKQRDSWRTVPLYTTPPQRTWVGLTAEEKQECINKSVYHTAWASDVDIGVLIDLVNGVLKEKNG